MTMKKLLLVVSAVVLLVVAFAAGCGSTAPTTYEQTSVWTGSNVPEPKDWHYDEFVFDSARGRLYLSDPSNARVDVWDATTGEYIEGPGGFTGTLGFDKMEFGQFGPNGLELDDQGNLWAGNGDGVVWVINTEDFSVIQKITTGATNKADVFAFDSTDGIMLVTCGDDDPAFMAFIDTKTYEVLGKIVLPADAQLAEPVWNEKDGKFYVGEYNAGGKVAVIDPLTRTVERTIDLGANCVPSALGFGPGTLLGVGSGTGYNPVIVDVATDKIVLTLDAPDSERGIGSVVYDKAWNRFFFSDTAGINVVDAGTLELLPIITGHEDPGGIGSRPLTIDPATHRLFGGHDKEGVVVFTPTSD
jgi:DNA-binding beta-propeller fold protein YncE